MKNKSFIVCISHKGFSCSHLDESVPDLLVVSPKLPAELPVEFIKEPDVTTGRIVFHNKLDYCDLQPKVEMEEYCQKGRVNGTLLTPLLFNYKNI